MQILLIMSIIIITGVAVRSSKQTTCVHYLVKRCCHTSMAPLSLQTPERRLSPHSGPLSLIGAILSITELRYCHWLERCRDWLSSPVVVGTRPATSSCSEPRNVPSPLSFALALALPVAFETTLEGLPCRLPDCGASHGGKFANITAFS